MISCAGLTGLDPPAKKLALLSSGFLRGTLEGKRFDGSGEGDGEESGDMGVSGICSRWKGPSSSSSEAGLMGESLMGN
jgi:hypothetical protein